MRKLCDVLKIIEISKINACVPSHDMRYCTQFEAHNKTTGDTDMKLLPQAQRAMKRLSQGKQPAKSTPMWILEGMEQALLIKWRHDLNEWVVVGQ